MPALALNGIQIPLAEGGLQEGPPEEIGETSRAVSGALRSSRRALKSTWTGTTPPLELATARALKTLLLGHGHVWSFDGDHLYSAKGKGPSSLTGTPTTPSASAKFPGRALQCTTSQGVEFPLDEWAAEYSVFAWYKLGAGAWTHYARSPSGFWVNGAATAEAWPSGFEVSGVVSVGLGTDTVRLDDLVALPCTVPLDWPAQVYAAGRAFGDAPKLFATGSALAGHAPAAGGTAPIEVVSTIRDAPIIRAAGGFRALVSFGLAEV